MGIGAGGSTVSNTLLLSNKLNASYRQDDYFFFFSFSSAAAVKSFMACSPVDSRLNSSMIAWPKSVHGSGRLCSVITNTTQSREHDSAAHLQTSRVQAIAECSGPP